MKLGMLVCGALLTAVVAGGCILVDDADEVWKASSIDEALVGTWSGTNIFKTLTIENCGDHLKLAIVGLASKNAPAGSFTNISARVTTVFGVKVLIIKDIMEVAMGGFMEMPKEPEGEHPSPYVHDFMLIPYRTRDAELIFSISGKTDIQEWILQEGMEAFLPKPPPARDFSDPVLTRLDEKTITALKARFEDGASPEDVYKKNP